MRARATLVGRVPAHAHSVLWLGLVPIKLLLGLVLQLVVHFLLAALVLEWGRGPGYG